MSSGRHQSDNMAHNTLKDYGIHVGHRHFPCGAGSVMDCHATARGSIPGGNGVFTELHVLRKGQ